MPRPDHDPDDDIDGLKDDETQHRSHGPARKPSREERDEESGEEDEDEEEDEEEEDEDEGDEDDEDEEEEDEEDEEEDDEDEEEDDEDDEEEEESRTYTVKSGDSLSRIAQRELGDASRWPEIHELNADEIPNPDLIQPGQVIYLPEE